MVVIVDNLLVDIVINFQFNTTMNKYKLINKQTGEEHLCDKVEIDGFDYYVSDENVSGKIAYNPNINRLEFFASHPKYDEGGKKVVATNNPNIDCPKVVNDVENIAYKWFVKANKKDAIFGLGWVNIFKGGYNKSQETHPNSDEDMKSFGKFCTEYDYRLFGTKSYEELLQLWKEQKPKTIYYE